MTKNHPEIYASILNVKKKHGHMLKSHGRGRKNDIAKLPSLSAATEQF